MVTGEGVDRFGPPHRRLEHAVLRMARGKCTTFWTDQVQLLRVWPEANLLGLCSMEQGVLGFRRVCTAKLPSCFPKAVHIWWHRTWTCRNPVLCIYTQTPVPVSPPLYRIPELVSSLSPHKSGSCLICSGWPAPHPPCSSCLSPNQPCHPYPGATSSLLSSQAPWLHPTVCSFVFPGTLRFPAPN